MDRWILSVAVVAGRPNRLTHDFLFQFAIVEHLSLSERGSGRSESNEFSSCQTFKPPICQKFINNNLGRQYAEAPNEEKIYQRNIVIDDRYARRYFFPERITPAAIRSLASFLPRILFAVEKHIHVGEPRRNEKFTTDAALTRYEWNYFSPSTTPPPRSETTGVESLTLCVTCRPVTIA